MKGRFPGLVSIRGRWHEHYCSGTLISDHFVLTSAFCVDAIGPNPIVVIGAYDLNDDRMTPGVHVSHTH